jgi:hypothetical protein
MGALSIHVIHKNPGIKNVGPIVFIGKERGIKWVKGLKGDKP